MPLEKFRFEVYDTIAAAVQTANSDIYAGMYQKTTPYVVFLTNGHTPPAPDENTSPDLNQVGININRPRKHPNKYRGCDDLDSPDCLESAIIDLFNYAVKEKEVEENGKRRSWQTFKDNLINSSVIDPVTRTKYSIRLGVIAMTVAPGTSAMDLPIPVEHANDNAVLIEFMRTALFAKLLHGDLNPGNFFIDVIPDSLKFGRRVALPFKNRITLIDLGVATDIPNKARYSKYDKKKIYTRDEFAKEWNNLPSKSLNDKRMFFYDLFDYIESSLNEAGPYVRITKEKLDKIFKAKGGIGTFEVTDKIIDYYDCCVEANTINLAKIKEIWGSIIIPTLEELYNYNENASLVSSNTKVSEFKTRLISLTTNPVVSIDVSQIGKNRQDKARPSYYDYFRNMLHRVGLTRSKDKKIPIPDHITREIEQTKEVYTHAKHSERAGKKIFKKLTTRARRRRRRTRKTL